MLANWTQARARIVTDQGGISTGGTTDAAALHPPSVVTKRSTLIRG